MPDNHILIFDLDGTLIDTMTQLADLFCDILRREHGIPDEVSRPIYVELAGKGPRPQFEAVLSTLGRLEPELVDGITERYWQVAETYEPIAFPETLDVLQQLRHDGHTLAVSSGGTTASVAAQDAPHRDRLPCSGWPSAPTKAPRTWRRGPDTSS